MKVLIEAPFTVTDVAKEAIESKINSLEKYNAGITRAAVYFKVKDGEVGDMVNAVVELHVPGPVLVGTADSQQFMEAFSEAANKAKSQLLKKKDKQTSR